MVITRARPLFTFLLRTIKRLVQKNGYCLESSTICKTVEDSLKGWKLPDKPRSYYSIEFGVQKRPVFVGHIFKINTVLRKEYTVEARLGNYIYSRLIIPVFCYPK